MMIEVLPSMQEAIKVELFGEILTLQEVITLEEAKHRLLDL